MGAKSTAAKRARAPPRVRRAGMASGGVKATERHARRFLPPAQASPAPKGRPRAVAQQRVLIADKSAEPLPPGLQLPPLPQVRLQKKMP